MEATRFLVLGAGRVGRAIAFDLAADEDAAVTVTDVSYEALDAAARLAPMIETVAADLGDAAAVAELAGPRDLVVGALPSRLGHPALRAVIEAGVDVVDISFFSEDPFALDALAAERGITALVDCGIAPGCSNMILGHAVATLDRVDRFVCLVGGIPADPEPPWHYRAPFAPIDVLAEYTRPARIVVDGEVVTRPALSDVETLELPEVGTVEAFLTDGLRTLLTTVDVPEMVEKTIRYPGHTEKMRVLRDAGFLSEVPVRVGGSEVAPVEVAARSLLPQWELDDAADLTVMHVIVEGVGRDGGEVRETWDLLDRRDRDTGLSSMARTTGFTAAAMARLVADGSYRRPGVSAPEHVGRVRECFERVLTELGQRGVEFEVRRERD